MSDAPQSSRFLGDCEAVRRRPGMYLGDVGKLGVARLITEAVVILTGLCVNREKFPYFTFHAHLDVNMKGRDVTIVVEFNPEEAPDIAARCELLVAGKDRFTKEDWPLGRRGGKHISPLPILIALSDRLQILRGMGRETYSVLAAQHVPVLRVPDTVCGAFVAARFLIGDRLELDGLTQDYLEGFLQGNRIAPGLVLRLMRVV